MRWIVIRLITSDHVMLRDGQQAPVLGGEDLRPARRRARGTGVGHGRWDFRGGTVTTDLLATTLRPVCSGWRPLVSQSAGRPPAG